MECDECFEEIADTNHSTSESTKDDKHSACTIRQLAVYNNIAEEYSLIGKAGPPFKKLYTVKLKLNNEEYVAEGTSIKKAKRSVGSKALILTKLKHPPPSTKKVKDFNPITPTVALNDLAKKRHEKVMYLIELAEDTKKCPQLNPIYPMNDYASDQTGKKYHPQRPSPGYNSVGFTYIPNFKQKYKSKPYAYSHSGESFYIRLHLGERMYRGVGITMKAAKHDAALRAVLDIQLKEMCQHMECSINNLIKSKSPISLVYDLALKLNAEVSFKIISEKSRPNTNMFTTQASILNIIGVGEGNSKKLSKTQAAKKLLEELIKLESFSVIGGDSVSKCKPAAGKKRCRNWAANSELADEKNPINVLTEIMRGNNEKEPVYTVVKQHGDRKNHEFTIEASGFSFTAKGVGCTKKLAKRNAAEALTRLIIRSTTGDAQNILKIDTVETPQQVTNIEDKQEQPIGINDSQQVVYQWEDNQQFEASRTTTGIWGD